MNIKEALTAAKKVLMEKIDNAMNNEVFQEVRDEEISTIGKTVYDAYKKPKLYQRRGELGGLADPGNIEIKGGTAKDGRMAVVNVTDPNPGGVIDREMVTTDKDLPALIEYGDGYKGYRYDFPGSAKFMEPRPFTQDTIEHLKESKAHVFGMRKGLQRQGVKVKK